VAFCTVNVGRSVDNCSSLIGDSTVGAPRVGAGVGAGGVVGELELQLDTTTRAANHAARGMKPVDIVTEDYSGEK